MSSLRSLLPSSDGLKTASLMSYVLEMASYCVSGIFKVLFLMNAWWYMHEGEVSRDIGHDLFLFFLCAPYLAVLNVLSLFHCIFVSWRLFFLLLKSSCCFLQPCIHLCSLSCFFLLAMSSALEDSSCMCEDLTCVYLWTLHLFH